MQMNATKSRQPVVEGVHKGAAVACFSISKAMTMMEMITVYTNYFSSKDERPPRRKVIADGPKLTVRRVALT